MLNTSTNHPQESIVPPNYLDRKAESLLETLNKAPLMRDFIETDVLTTLMSINAIEQDMSADGVPIVKITNIGKNILTNRIAIQRPAGPGATVVSYDQMLSTMTPSALNALVRALSSSGRLAGPDLTRSTATLLFERMMQEGTFNLAYNSTIFAAADLTARILEKRLNVREERIRVGTSMLLHWNGVLLDCLKSIVEDLGGQKKVLQPYIFGDWSLDTIAVSDTLFAAIGTHRWTGESIMISVDELPLAAIEYFLHV